MDILYTRLFNKRTPGNASVAGRTNEWTKQNKKRTKKHIKLHTHTRKKKINKQTCEAACASVNYFLIFNIMHIVMCARRYGFNFVGFHPMKMLSTTATSHIIFIINIRFNVASIRLPMYRCYTTFVCDVVSIWFIHILFECFWIEQNAWKK